ncbi:MAG: uracil-DNA glycosylase [Puniceicoccales bacterium]|jgi:DNA polymerase|nr:uracil-DNA glycosylase [Puniceicoccales bacterium]
MELPSREEILAALRREVAELENFENSTVGPAGPGPLAGAPADAAEKSSPDFPTDSPCQASSAALPGEDKKKRWDCLRDRVLGCPVCNSHVSAGKRVVFGVGNLNADIFFCGEAPGAEEEIAGEPFVGPSGKLLNEFIGAMGLKRSQVYISNILNWRPEAPKGQNNRPPTRKEMDFCLPYLRAQVEIVQPKVIVTLGNSAIHGFLDPSDNRPMYDLRREWHSWSGVPLRATYHPSHLLRNRPAPSQPDKLKRQVWEDLLLVMERVQLPISPEQRDYFR